MTSVLHDVRLPHAEHAIIPREKVLGYLLSQDHPIGRYKAEFFALLGYSRRYWRRLEADLRRIARTNEAVPGTSGRHGREYIVRGRLEGPFRSAPIDTVWIVRKDSELPALVTAYPDTP